MDSNTGPDAPLPGRDRALLRRGRMLEGITLGWNAAGIVVLAIAAVRARSAALAGFGLNSLIEIGASVVVLWEVSAAGERQRRALRLIGGAFLILAACLAAQSGVVLATGYHPGPSLLGIIWTAATAAAMFALARLWWADPLAALVIVSYALREAREIFLPGLLAPGGMAKARETP